MELAPLDGFVIGITADRRWQEQADLLCRRGAAVMHGPTMSTLRLVSEDHLRAVTAAVIADPPDYLLATTGIGVRAWTDAASTWGMDDALTSALARARIVARGPKASATVQALGLEVWGRAGDETVGDALGLLLEQPLKGRRVAVQHYGDDAQSVTDALRAAGAEVIEVKVYRWRIPDDTSAAERLIAAACRRGVDAITFTSAPAVANLFAVAARQQAEDDLLRALNDDVVVACVGPVCAEGARRLGVTAPLVPESGRLGLLVRALSEHFAERRRILAVDGRKVVSQGSVIEVDGERIELSPRERAVWEPLLARPGAVVSRARLLAGGWDDLDDEHVVEVAISRLRRRLGPVGSAIETVSGRGYRLSPDP